MNTRGLTTAGTVESQSNECYAIRTIYREFTWPRERMTWLLQQFIVGWALARGQGHLNHVRYKYWIIWPGKLWDTMYRLRIRWRAFVVNACLCPVVVLIVVPSLLNGAQNLREKNTCRKKELLVLLDNRVLCLSSGLEFALDWNSVFWTGIQWENAKFCCPILWMTLSRIQGPNMLMYSWHQQRFDHLSYKGCTFPIWQFLVVELLIAFNTRNAKSWKKS
jgi:hypothetical protein